jgi:hypothetical protein
MLVAAGIPAPVQQLQMHKQLLLLQLLQQA